MTAPTPGQTVGPFFHDALPFADGPRLASADDPHALTLHGVVYDGHGEPVPDALVELWQADPDGRVPQVPGSLSRDGAAFTGFGRAATDSDGRYGFATIRPDAPFVALTVFARGLLDRLFTRAYLPRPDEPHGFADDALLTGLDAERRATLLAEADAPGSVRFDIRLQGEGETVFLDFARY